MKASKINRFLLFKLPSAWFCGVRVQSITEESCTTSVKYKWINQNPFNSIFWAVQGMAAELSTGALVMNLIAKKEQKISMLVVSASANFYKKARGRVRFNCTAGKLVNEAVEKTIQTGLPQTFWLESKGIDEQDVIVSTFNFEWSIKPKH